MILFSVCFFSCTNSPSVESVKEDELFSLSYGRFEDQLNMFDLSDIGNVHTTMTMRDGFFYIANGEAEKIMELNSYGDLLTLYYNEPEGESETRSMQNTASKRKSIAYPFTDPEAIAVDSKKRMYVVSTMPKERQEENEDGTLLYSQIILRFASDGTSEDYIGQQGIGGTPFPFIKNIYTTSSDELVVVCITTEGRVVYWFSEAGFLMYQIPILIKDAPKTDDAKAGANGISVLQDVIPDCTSRRLFVKVDYYEPRIDEDSKTEAGIDFIKSCIYPLAVETGKYGNPIVIPPYEETVSADYSKLVFRLPYDFLGVSNSGWLFFIISTDTGFGIEMVQLSGQKVIKRHFDVPHDDILYYVLSLSESGIISALFIEKEKARVVWWRTDSLSAAIVKS